MSSRRPIRLGLAALSDPMTRNSIALMGNTVVTSALGYVFWIIVARLFDTEAGGTAAATTSAIQATVLTASVGAAAALVEWLPRSEDAEHWRQRVTTAWVVGAVTALLGASVVVAALGYGFGVLPQLATPPGAMLFVLGCVFFSVGQVIDYVAICEHRGGLLMMRNMVLSGLRIPLLLLPISVLTGADSILLSWTLAAALSLIWASVFFGRGGGRCLRPSFTGMRTCLREMASTLVGQHLITVTAMLAGYVLPIIVVGRLSATDNAYFYITWMLGSVFFIISPAVSAALFVEGAAEPAKLPQQARRCLVIIMALLAVPVLVYVVAGRWILGVFGADYAQHGYVLLLVLAASSVPDAISNVAVSVLRVTRRVRAALTLNVVILIGSVVGAWYALPVLGIVGAGLAWTLSQTLGAAWVLLRWKQILGGGAQDPGAVPSVADDVVALAGEGSLR